MFKAAKWYIIHTYSGYENKVAQNIEKVVKNRRLQDFIQAVQIPTETIIEIIDGKEKKSERKIFPGYVLIKMVITDDTWYIVKNIRGCTGFVGPGSIPTPITNEELKKISGVDTTTNITINFKEGDRVQISGTAMDGFIGVVKSINLNDRTADILVSIFGRETPATLPVTQIITLDN